MKKHKVILLFMLASFFGILQSYGQSKCRDVSYHDKCYEGARFIFDDYVYLKSRPFTRDAQNTKFELYLRKGTLYLFNICEGEESDVTINLYNPEGDAEAIASNYIEEGRHSRILSILPKRSGKYSISVSFSENSPRCVVVVQGMIRRNIESYIQVPEE